MAYAWKPNADAGSVRSHSRPSTVRRYRDPITHYESAHPMRVQMRAALRTLVATGDCYTYTPVTTTPRRGWDEGDPLSFAITLV